MPSASVHETESSSAVSSLVEPESFEHRGATLTGVTVSVSVPLLLANWIGDVSPA